MSEVLGRTWALLMSSGTGPRWTVPSNQVSKILTVFTICHLFLLNSSSLWCIENIWYKQLFFYTVNSDVTSTSRLGSIHEGCVRSSDPWQSNGNNSSAIKCGRIKIKGAKVIWNSFEVIENATLISLRKMITTK